MGSHSVTASAELGWLYGTRFESGHVDALTEVERWGRRAVEVDPGSSLGWSVLAAAEGFRGFPDPQEALTYGLRGATGGSAGGRELNSLGNVVDFGGLSLDLALEAYGEAASIDPIHAYARSNAALTLLSLGRFEEALPYFDAALRIRPEDRWMYFGKWVALTRLGRAGEASAAWEGLLEIEGEEGPGAVIGRILEDLSKPGESSLQATRRLQRLLDDDSVLTEFNKIQVAAGLYPLTAGAAAIDLTFELIDLSIAGGWPPPYDLLALSPLFDPVRQDPRFAAALAEARRRFDLLRSVLDRARVRDELPGFLETPLADLLARLEAAGYLDASA